MEEAEAVVEAGEKVKRAEEDEAGEKVKRAEEAEADAGAYWT